MFFSMRTTIRLDDALLVEAKRHALESGTTLTAVIEEALRDALRAKDNHPPPAPFKMLTFGGGGLRPGVDLDDSAALLDLMEGRGGADE